MAAHEQAGSNAKKLIRAVVEHVDHNEFPPSELITAQKCQRWNVLPEGGGLYDQEAQLLHRMTVLLNVYQALTRFRNRQGKDIHNMPLDERKIIGSLRNSGFI